MTVRTTSVETYREITDNGLLSTKRLQVYEVLYQHGPLTGAQVSQRVKAKFNFGRSGTSETIRNRLTELRDLGCVKELGTTLCPITGRNVILWDVTANLPAEEIDKPDRKTRRQIEEENEQMRQALLEIETGTTDNWAAARAGRALGKEAVAVPSALRGQQQEMRF